MKRNSDSIKVKKFDFQYLSELKLFISKYWRKDHPIILSDPLFKWQYYGFGRLRGYDNFQLLFDDNKLIGFRAVIPLELQISKNSISKIETCLASAMWMVSPDYRGMGLGYLIHHNTENSSEASLAIGANPNTSVPLYLRSGYHEIKRFNRYIIPLNSDYEFLLIRNCDKGVDLRGWLNDLSDFPIYEENTNIAELSEVWTLSTSSVDLVALHRSEEYWKWRYLDSPVFKYHIFGGKEKGGIVVVRIENVMGDIQKNVSVLRIIEAIPSNPDVWNYKRDNSFEQLLKSVLSWGQKKGCSAADFHCSTNKLYTSFRNVGFIEQPVNFEPSILSMSDFFQPMVFEVHHYNGYLRLGDQEINNSFNYENSYFVRSDTDQDRVNVLNIYE